jgi:hypothetical protein
MEESPQITRITRMMKCRNRERRENTRKLAMGPRCGQLALAVGNMPALRVHFSLLIANWQRYALTPLLIAIFSFFAVFGFVRG